MSADEDTKYGRGSNAEFVRVTARMPKPLLDELDDEVDAGEWKHRSEALRSIVRDHCEGSECDRCGRSADLGEVDGRQLCIVCHDRVDRGDGDA